MEIIISLEKGLEESAGNHFERAKKLRRKIAGAEAALLTARKKLDSVSEQLRIEESRVGQRRSRKWFEKFRWFHTSEGLLVIGGRDAQSNEIIIKKHTEPVDLVFHTDMAGSPFFVLKTEGKTPGEASLAEAASATASYSRGWKLGHADVKVAWFHPEQVSKTAKSGEYLGRGAFIISGKANYVAAEMRLGIGILDGQVIGGPLSALKSRSERFVEVIQGDDKPSSAAKLISKMTGGEIDEIMRFLPSGTVKVKQAR
jgi:predicted ribosome quality control (RQC) complex YloA/Tae2 family protein